MDRTSRVHAESEEGGPPFTADVMRALTDDGWLRRLAVALAGSEADDVLQDVALRGLKHGRNSEDAGPWFATVLRNRVASLWRASVRRERREREVAPTEATESASDVASRDELRRLVAHELLALAEPYRTTLLRRFFEGRSHDEIAAAERVSVGTVRWRQHRALELLRERLDRGHRGDRRAWLALVAHHFGAAFESASGVVLMKAKSSGIAVFGALLVGAVCWLLLRGEGPSSHDVSDMAAVPVEASAPVAVDHEAGSTEREAVSSRTDVDVASSATPLDRARLRLRFVDEENAPIAGARVVAVRRSSGVSSPDDPETESDADGRIVLDVGVVAGPGTPVGGRLGVTIRFGAPGHVGGSLKQVLTRLGHETNLGTLTLPRGGTITGRVIDDQGLPISQAIATCGATDTQRHRSRFRYDMQSPSARTDSNGEFVLDGVAPGFTTVQACHPAHVGSSEPEVAVVARARVRVPDLVLSNADPSRIHGIVRDLTGVPVPGMSITLTAFLGEPKKVAATWFETSDDQGNFSVGLENEGLIRSPTRFDLDAWDPEHRFGAVHLEDIGSTPMPLVVAMPSPTRRTLRVVATDGAPIETYFGMLDVFTGDESRSTVPLSSRGFAHYERGELEFVLPARPFHLNLFAPGFSPATVGPYEPASVGSEIVVTLTRLPLVRGRVVHEGRPVSGAIVSLTRDIVAEYPDMASIALVAGTFPSRFVPASLAVAAVADADGRFEVAPSKSGVYRLLASAAGCGNASTRTFEYPPASELEEFTIELPRAGSIVGELAGGSIDELAYRIVGISNGEGFIRSVRADAEGRFRFDDVAPGHWLVALSEREVTQEASGGFSIGETEPQSPAHAREIAVEPGRECNVILDVSADDSIRVRGRVVFTGEAPAAHRISILPITPSGTRVPGSRVRETVLLPDGSYELSAATPGRHRIDVWPAHSLGCFSKDVELQLGDNEVAFEFEVGRTRVTSGDEDAMYRFTQSDSSRQLRVDVLFSGRRSPSEIRALPGTASIVRVRHDPTVGDFVPEPGATPVAIEIPRDGAIEFDLDR